MKKLKRVYKRYEEWEEVKHNMWGEVKDKEKYLKRAIKLTGNHELYGSYMKRVISEMPISCENALTDYNQNRKAWIGHAAVALALKCPEDIVRKAWGYLTDEQRKLANLQAEKAISDWEKSYRKSKNLYTGMEEQMLF
jgi:hypothetical protein